MVRLGSYTPAIILALGCVLLLGNRGQRAIPLSSPLSGVLPALDGYDVQDQKITDAERDVAGMTDYVARVYSRGSTAAFTTLVSYYDRQSRGSSIHSPRNCLPGAGWEVLSGGTETIIGPGGPHLVNRYLLKNGPSRAVVYYWYQGRGRIVASEFAVKWNLLEDAALRGHTEEALVRVVVPVRVPSANSAGTVSVSAASDLGKSIAARLMNDLDRVLPRSGKA